MLHEPREQTRIEPHRLRHFVMLMRARKEVLAIAGSLLFAVLFRSGSD